MYSIESINTLTNFDPCSHRSVNEHEGWCLHIVLYYFRVRICQWSAGQMPVNPLRTMLGGVPVFLPSGQLSGSTCQNPSAGNQRFYNYVYVYVYVYVYMYVTCTCQHYYAIFMHSACVPVHAHVHTMRLYTSLAYLSVCGYTRQPGSGISQAANRTQGVKDWCNHEHSLSEEQNVHERYSDGIQNTATIDLINLQNWQEIYRYIPWS